MNVPDCNEVCWYQDCADCPACSHVIHFRRQQEAEVIMDAAVAYFKRKGRR